MVGVIPSGTPDPWQWAKGEVDANNALTKMFADRQTQELLLKQRLEDSAADRTWRTSEAEADRAWRAGQNEERNENALEVAGIRGPYGSRGYKVAAGELAPELQALQPKWREYEKANGLPEGYLNAIMGPESGGDRYAKNPRSSASGLFQMTADTARALGYDPSIAWDPDLSAKATAELARRNGDAYRARTGKDPSLEVYAGSHFLGAPGYHTATTQPWNTVWGSLGAKVAVANKVKPNVTNEQFLKNYTYNTVRAHELWKQRQAASGTQTPATQAATQQPTTQSGVPASSQQQPQATPAGGAPSGSVTGTGVQGGGSGWKQVVGPNGEIRFIPG